MGAQRLRRRRRRGRRRVRVGAFRGGLGPRGVRPARGGVARLGHPRAERGRQDRRAGHRAGGHHHRVGEGGRRGARAVHAWGAGRARPRAPADRGREPWGATTGVLPGRGGAAPGAGAVPGHVPAAGHVVRGHDGELHRRGARGLPLERRGEGPRRVPLRLRAHVHRVRAPRLRGCEARAQGLRLLPHRQHRRARGRSCAAGLRGLPEPEARRQAASWLPEAPRAAR
mmetsp:Transcript_339/g.981  ORF Transcript_339/g.981 Transcript_339/m.981 type:complete len:227 (+) Transcript_339:1270-1950(+)